MINIKLKICGSCELEKQIWKNFEGVKYCKECWYTSSDNQKKNYTIKKVSTKQELLNKEYSKLRKIFLEKHPMCQASLPGCSSLSTDVHHRSLRGENYLVVSTWLSLCRFCHSWCHLNPKEAREKGLLD